MAELDRKEVLARLAADLRLSILTVIGLQLRQQMDTPEQLPPALATLIGNKAEPDRNKVEEPQG
jgi:hypothetical protein